MATAAGAIAIAVAAGVLLLDSRGSDAVALAAQAYAQTSATPEQIVYTLATVVRTTQTGAQAERETGRIEEWHRGGETHRIETYVSQNGTKMVLDHVIDSAGVMRQITQDGSYRIVRKTDNQDAANVIAQQQAGFVEEFRTRYEDGELDPAGDVQFAGRPARRYLVPDQADSPGPHPPGAQQAYYIDRETGAPLGYTSTLPMGSIRTPQAGPQPFTVRYVLTVRTIKRLEPTPANLEALRTLSLPRRRDANGCIRGPITGARNSDTASKSDCGGTPGAPLPD